MPVTVQFYGICTHISPDAVPPQQPEWSHRVVLVNASHPRRFDPHRPHLAVAPHVARLQILAADLVGPPMATPWFPITHDDGIRIEWNLLGVTLSIANAIPNLGSPDVPTCIPSLKHYVGDPKAIGRLGPRAYEPNAEETSCFFDFESAPLVGKELDPGGAAVGVITVESTDPQLVVRSFGGQSLQFPISPHAEISVSNVPEDSKADKDDDFLLHFLVLEKFPLEARSPHHKIHCAQQLVTRNPPIRIGELSTPGCSNSGYP